MSHSFHPRFFDLLGLHALGLGEAHGLRDPLDSPMPAVVDPVLIDRARRGQAEARAALLDGLQDLWYRYTLSLLRDPDQARDATQETALRFLSHLNRFRGDSTLKTWSLGIATNVCRERRRQRQTRRLQDVDDASDVSPGPGQRAEMHEQRDRLLAVLGDLPDRQREAVVLRYFEQLPVRETAAAMGCAEGTVKATLSQAIRSLRTRLGVRFD